jgi:hypothetical protein
MHRLLPVLVVEFPLTGISVGVVVINGRDNPTG